MQSGDARRTGSTFLGPPAQPSPSSTPTGGYSRGPEQACEGYSNEHGNHFHGSNACSRPDSAQTGKYLASSPARLRIGWSADDRQILVGLPFATRSWLVSRTSQESRCCFSLWSETLHRWWFRSTIRPINYYSTNQLGMVGWSRRNHTGVGWSEDHHHAVQAHASGRDLANLSWKFGTLSARKAAGLDIRCKAPVPSGLQDRSGTCNMASCQSPDRLAWEGNCRAY